MKKTKTEETNQATSASFGPRPATPREYQSKGNRAVVRSRAGTSSPGSKPRPSAPAEKSTGTAPAPKHLSLPPIDQDDGGGEGQSSVLLDAPRAGSHFALQEKAEREGYPRWQQTPNGQSAWDDSDVDHLLETLKSESTDLHSVLVESHTLPGSWRLETNLQVPSWLGEWLMNSAVGLRGHYYRSPEEGREFTERCMELFRQDMEDNLSSAVDTAREDGAPVDFFNQDKLNQSLAGAKFWMRGGGATTDGELETSTWVPDDDFRWKQETDPEFQVRKERFLRDTGRLTDEEVYEAGTDGLGAASRWTASPEDAGMTFSIMTSFVAANGDEPWLPEHKKFRDVDIHLQGWS